MTTAFVLSGGGSLGAIQVGMLQAFAEHGITPDILIGTSVGALNAAYVAGHGMSTESLAELERTWLGLSRADVFPFEPLRLIAATLGKAESLCSNGPLRRLIEAHLTFKRLEDADIPIHVVTTDVRSGMEVLLSKGDAVTAILASAAIPAVFPAVKVNRKPLVDGGIADNAAISQAIDLGADLIYVLPTGYACALDKAPTTALGAAVHSLTLLIEQRLIVDIGHYSDRADIRVAPPLCPLNVSSVDFSQSRRLLTDARSATGRWLKNKPKRQTHPEAVLSLHSH